MRDITFTPEIAKHEGARLLRDTEADVLVGPSQLAWANPPIPYSKITWPAKEPEPKVRVSQLKELSLAQPTRKYKVYSDESEMVFDVSAWNMPIICPHPAIVSDRNYVHCNDCGLVFELRKAPEGLASMNSTAAETKNKNPDRSFDEDSGQEDDGTHSAGIDHMLRERKRYF